MGRRGGEGERGAGKGEMEGKERDKGREREGAGGRPGPTFSLVYATTLGTGMDEMEVEHGEGTEEKKERIGIYYTTTPPGVHSNFSVVLASMVIPGFLHYPSPNQQHRYKKLCYRQRTA